MMEYGRSYAEYQLKKRGVARRLTREFYLNASFRLLKGRTIDFGCGPGELLRKLPEGSIGLEINTVTVAHCQNMGLNVQHYDPQKDKYQLSGLEPGKYDSLILSHVLEHLENPEQVLRMLLRSARRLEVKRVVIITPGKKGFFFDPTHKTFISPVFFKKNKLEASEGFKLVRQRYFPGKIKFLEHLFTYLELQVVYDKTSDEI